MLQCFSAQLSLWKTIMILTQQPGHTVFLSKLVFVISGTWGYRSGLESLMWHSVVSYYLKIYKQTGYDKERRSWHLKRRFPISQSCVRNANGDSFAFSTFLEQLDKKREGIYEKGFTKDSKQPHNHRRIAKRLVTKPSIISEEKKKKKSVICSGL